MKITKKLIEQLIKEEIGGVPQYSGDGVYPGYGYMKNAPDGKLPDNNTYEPYKGREPYPTDAETPKMEEGQMFVAQGKNVYLLEFVPNSDRMAGRLTPVGYFEFTVNEVQNALNWNESAPANVKFDAKLEKQILEFRGVDKG